MRKAFVSLLPTPIHTLLSPLYAYRQKHFQDDWASRTNDSKVLRPDCYIDIDKNALLLADAVEKFAGKDASVLDLCCNCGRHMQELWNRGFRKLHGVDINAHAIEYSKTAFPRMQADVRLTAAPVEDYLKAASDKSFDVVISRGIALEFVAPSFPLVKELARVTRRYAVFFIQDNPWPYPRMWPLEFKRQGFQLVEYRCLPYAKGNTNAFVFASPEEFAALRPAQK